MIAQRQISLFTIFTSLTLVGNLIFPISVRADDAPPVSAPTEEAASIEEENQTHSSETDAPPQEPAPVSEILEQLPENTELVVTDENGEILPLAAVEAAEMIVAGDPIWCADGVAPNPADSNCSPSFTSMAALISWLNTNNPNQAGTIWIEDSYDSSANDPLVSINFFNGATLTNMANHSLTIQGGWSGVTGDTTITGSSEFNNSIFVQNWNAGVTINNIFSTGATFNAIDVETTGDINLNNVTANNSVYGATLDNCRVDFSGPDPVCTGTGNVNLNNVTFNGHTSNGAQVMSNGEVNVTNITANQNGNIGLVINNSLFSTGDNDVTINGVNQFNSNDNIGLTISSNGHIHVSNSEASGNNSDGFDLRSNGDITLNNATANNNLGDGAYLEIQYGIGNVFVSNGQFNNNAGYGVRSSSQGNTALANITANENVFVGIGASSIGQITLSNFMANGNNEDGVVLLSFDIINVNGGQAVNNSFGGIGAFSFSNIQITNVISDSHEIGAGLYASGTVTVICSAFSNNTDKGIEADTPELNLIGVTFTNNALDYENTYPTGAVNVFDYDCNPSTGMPKKPSGGTGGLPLNIVQGGSAQLDCDNFSGTTLVLPNGDKVTFKCPIRGSASANRLAGDALPGALPDGVEYVSGLTAIHSPDGSDVALGGLVFVSFVVPADMQGEDFAILYWNGTEWVDLDTAAFDDGRIVLNGGYFTSDGYFEAVTNFSGSFVLVKN